jgi:cell division septum initiation protein DivIVA
LRGAKGQSTAGAKGTLPICDDLKFVLQTFVSAKEVFLTEIAAPPTMSDMLEDLDRLEERIGALAQLTREMRVENHALRQELHDAVAQVRSLKSRLEAARLRIEALIEKLPVTE